MSRLELLAIMSAIIYPSVDFPPEYHKGEESVTRAIKILSEVEKATGDKADVNDQRLSYST